MLTPAEIIGLLAPTTPDLTPRIGSLARSWIDAGRRIECHLHYVKFRDSKPTIDDLIEIAHARLVNFVMPRSRINDAIAEFNADQSSMDQWMRLCTEARDLFIKTDEETGRSGELGELLLYMLIEWVLGAPIVACKMYLKTAQQMPIHGVDGIHLGYEGNKLIVYWGESKLHTSPSSARDSIISSIAKYHNDSAKHATEIRIIRANLNIEHIESDARQRIKNYFNPYKSESNELIEKYSCLAGFDTKLYDQVQGFSDTECEAAFCAKYTTWAHNFCDSISEKIEISGLNLLRFSYFLLPFPSVDEARSKFQNRLWGKR
jgi:hypothetical protein